MRAGGLRQRLVIERNDATVQGSLGGLVDNWQPVITCRARAAFKSGSEFERAKQITADITTLLIIRYDSRLDTAAMHAMRIRGIDDGVTFRIIYAADPDRRRRQIHIHARESQSI